MLRTSANDSRIMLRILVTEAARFRHLNLKGNKSVETGKAVGPKSPMSIVASHDCLDGAPIPSSSWHVTSPGSDRSVDDDWSPGADNDEDSQTLSNAESRSPSCQRDVGHYATSPVLPPYIDGEWLTLLDQMDYAWDTTFAATTEEKYLRLKCRLTSLLLWDLERASELDLAHPPIAVLEDMNRRHSARLQQLPPGKLFHRVSESLNLHV